MMFVRDGYSRFTKTYFLRSKDDAAEYLMKYLVDIAPRKVDMVRSDGGGRILRASLVPCVPEKIKC